ncbi:PQQ-binding-like beta-propeller repeat protein [Streptomyces sp. PTY087I2]|uniref:outer membrane protein assembly factor BamB family protein n=1 Tax=Streptomyces sp. PTY087I2 TaxID=1819298 RepID=UPI00080B602F|nr:PQQ-binding-like beta-propeller repeat protein [Streptomyces sp. PTY087I2]OCC09313.1 Outer membrane protein assembly factor BamB [Streptomyces sp. PTY087I2]
MSQPPPQEGFGAPYEPRPGVYGDPGQPQPGPYGQPPQPAYGSPPQPPTVPYGRPQPQPQPPNRPSGGRSRGRVVGLVAAVLAGVLVIGAGVWLGVRGDDGSDDKKPVAKESTAPKQPGAESNRKKTPAAEAAEINKGRKEGEAKVRWIQKNGVDLPGRGASALGPWVTGGIVAKAMYRTVSGYSLEDGSQKWSLPLPADVCAAPTQPTVDGKLVIGLMSATSKEEAACEKLQMIDLATGEAGWSKTFPQAPTQDGLRNIVMAISGDVLTIGRIGRSDAYRVSDGKHLWGKVAGPCYSYAMTGGAAMFAAVACGKQPIDEADSEVRRIDPVTGKTVWTYKPKEGWMVGQFYSVDPLVLLLQNVRDPKDDMEIVVLNTDGTFRSQLVVDEEKLGVQCTLTQRNLGANFDTCIGLAADADTLYLASRYTVEDGSWASEVLAFDMSTGKEKWKVRAPTEQTLTPLRVEGGRALIYLSPPRSKAKGVGGGIVALGPQGGALEPVLRHPASAAATERTLVGSLVLYADGRSLLMRPHVSGDTDEEEMEMRTMIAFGD